MFVLKHRTWIILCPFLFRSNCIIILIWVASAALGKIMVPWVDCGDAILLHGDIWLLLLVYLAPFLPMKLPQDQALFRKAIRDILCLVLQQRPTWCRFSKPQHDIYTSIQYCGMCFSCMCVYSVCSPMPLITVDCFIFLQLDFYMVWGPNFQIVVRIALSLSIPIHEYSYCLTGSLSYDYECHDNYANEEVFTITDDLHVLP